MLKQYKELLYKMIVDLCHKMNTVKVTSELLKYRKFDRTDLERVMEQPTTMLKNEVLVTILLERDFDTFSEFLRSLSSIDQVHLALAEAIQPVRFRILWFSISPVHAAAVVHTLEKYAKATFSKMQRIGEDKSLILRRGRVFKREYSETELDMDVQELEKYSHEVEVCLVFPTFSSDPIASLETCFKECLISHLNLLVMGGVCEENRQGGHCFVISQSTNREGVCVKPIGYDLTVSPIRGANIDQAVDKLCDHFGRLQTKSCPMQDLSDNGVAGKSVSNLSLAFDPTTFDFYSICQRYFPETRSFVCLGNMASVGVGKLVQGVEPIGQCDGMESAAIISARAVMNIIEYCYKHTMNELM